MAPMSDVILETTNLAKSYSGVPVLTGISIQVRKGVVLGIIGENGAGKSTFIKCLNGMTEPSSGEIRFMGQAWGNCSVAGAIAEGLVTIPQEFNLVNDLNVYENLFLGHELRTPLGLLDRRRMRRRAAELLAELEADIPPDRLVGSLGVAEKQMVEIAKALTSPCRLLIMDEPTTVLNQNEVATLFKVMRRLKESGVSILYISHKLKEVKTICDEVVVLRDGQFISHDPIDALDEAEMARRMVGRELHQMFPPKVSPAPDAQVVLDVRHLTVPGVLEDVTFSLRQGEILGFAGLVGSGRTELAETLYGIRKATAGTVEFFGRPGRFSSPQEALKAGLAYLSEDRQGTGILTEFPLAANVTLASLKAYCHPFIRKKEEAAKAESYIEKFRIKTDSLQTQLKNLSGGNQQKVSIAKNLDTSPRLFIFDEPTRGIDINAKSEVYAFIRELVSTGVSCILISSDLEEVLGLCERIAVMRGGRLAGILEGDKLTDEEIMYLATGVKG